MSSPDQKIIEGHRQDSGNRFPLQKTSKNEKLRETFQKVSFHFSFFFQIRR